MLRKAAYNGRLTGSQIHSQASAVTHLLFADDSFLFCKASMEEVMHLRSILQTYEMLSGQAINFQKSGIFFSANVRTDKQMEIKERIGVLNDLSEGRYLGLPSLVGGSRKRVFSFLKDRL